MDWVKPEHSSGQVNKAGKSFVHGDLSTLDYFDALEIINNWRASHQYPLNILADGLRKRSKAIDPKRTVAQRIKRLHSISLKMFLQPSMRLTQMQDLGGCRVILSNISQVRLLVKALERSDIKHKLIDRDDYITEPKASGYRGVHLVYSYYSDKKAPSVYNGLKIEVQIRSMRQHAWATAVEIVGTIIGQSLKSGQGDADWLRFFSLMGSVIAIKEKTALIPGTPTAPLELYKELKEVEKKLNAQQVLTMYNHALQVSAEKMDEGEYHFLLNLDSQEKVITIQGFKKNEADFAKNALISLETTTQAQKINSKTDVVLVSVDSLRVLKKAYPNYFMDSMHFVNILSSALKE